MELRGRVGPDRGRGPRPHRRRLRRAAADLRRVPAAGRGARRVPRRARRRRRVEGRDRPREPPRVPRGLLRRAPARGRPGQRELPLRRRGDPLPARRLGRGRGGHRGALRRHRPRRRRSAPGSGAARGRARARLRRRGGPRASRRHPPARRRRPDLPLHRGHHRDAQGRHVAQRRPLRRPVADGPPRHRAADPLAAVRAGQAVGHGPPRLPAHARHRAVHHTLDPLGRGHRRADRRDGPRREPDLGRDRPQRRRGADDRRRRLRPAAARRARTRPRPVVARNAAGDHVEWGHLEPRGQARPARPPPRHHPPRLARRVRGTDVAIRGASRGHRDRTGAASR